MTRPAAPYPPETRAKGWRFELDYEQIEQSDTWDLAGPEGRPWLLMMWFVSWRQVPCGSYPADEAVIAAKLGMPPKAWAKHRAVLLRGWSEAEDGRLYHVTLTQRVIEMMKRRRSDSDRQAEKRRREAEEAAKKAAESRESPGEITEVSRVTPTGVGPESSTDHRPPNTENQKPKSGKPVAAPPLPARAAREPEPDAQPTAAGLACRAIKAAGIADVNPGHPTLLSLLEAGQTPELLAATATELAGKGKAKFALLLATVEGRLRDAAAAGAVPLAAAAAAAAAPDAWRRDSRQVVAMGKHLAVPEYPGDTMPEYERRVVTAWRKAGCPAPATLTEGTPA